VSAPEVTEHRLGPADALPVGEGRAYAVGDEQVAVFRLRDGTLRAVTAICPHAGGPLADGMADTGKLVCPLHNHTFSLADGACLNGPFSVRVFPVREADGQLLLEM